MTNFNLDTVVNANRTMTPLLKTDNSPRPVPVEIKPDSPLSKDKIIVISVVADKKDDVRKSEVIEALIKLRDRLPEALKKKLVILDPLDKTHEMKMSGLYMDNGVSMKDKLTAEQYQLTVKNVMNRVATISLNYVPNAEVTVMLGRAEVGEASHEIFKYLTGEKKSAGIKNNSEAKKDVETLKGYYFEKAWDYFLEVPENKESAFTFLKENYHDNEKLFKAALQKLQSYSRTGNEATDVNRLIELLTISGGEKKKNEINDQLYDLLRGRYQDTAVRDMALRGLGLLDLHNILFKYNTGDGNKTKLLYEIIDTYCADTISAAALGKMIKLLFCNKTIVYENIEPLLEKIFSISSKEIRNVFVSNLNYFSLAQDSYIQGYMCKGNVGMDGRISFSDEGKLILAQLASSKEIAGVVYGEGAIVEFNKKGKLSSVKISRETVINGYPCKANTWVSFDDESGKVSWATLAKNMVIDGYHCKKESKIGFDFHSGKIYCFTLASNTMISDHFFPEGTEIQLRSPIGRLKAILGKEATIQHNAFKSGTILYFDGLDRLSGAVLYEDTEIQGIVCQKTTEHSTFFPSENVTFYSNGKLKSGRLGKDKTLKNVYCEKGTRFKLFKNGNVKYLELVKEVLIQGIRCKSGAGVDFHKNGVLRESTCARDCVIQGIFFKEETPIYMHETGKLSWVSLSKDCLIQGINFKEGTEIVFDKEGKLSAALIKEDHIIYGKKYTYRTYICFDKKGKIIDAYYKELDTNV